jgi:hypothetical protein
MKKIISIILLSCFISNIALADCTWSTGVTKLSEESWYRYSSDCNLRVGEMVQELDTKSKQLEQYDAAITLKDLAIQKSDARVLLWKTTAEDEQDRMNKLSTEQKHTDFLFFGLGVLAAIGAGFMASKLIHP